jgi:hypothetical protein
MKRRDIVFGAAGLWPVFVAHGFAQEGDAHTDLRAAWRRAERAQRGLLIFVVPHDRWARRERGDAFGALIQHGSEASLQAQGSVDLACASMREAARVFRTVPQGEPRMLLVAPDGSVSVLDGTPTPTEGRDGRLEGELALLESLVQDALHTRVEALSEAERASALARAVSYRRVAIPGSRWVRARLAPCDGRVRGGVRTVSCGMGHIPELAQRFLAFYTQG